MTAIRTPLFQGNDMATPPPVAWTIQVNGANIQAHTFYLQEKNQCFLSAHTKLAGFDKMVRLSSHELAQSFIDALGDVIKKRTWGDDVRLTVEPLDGLDRRTDFDDAVVLARMKERNFAPNKAPKK